MATGRKAEAESIYSQAVTNLENPGLLSALADAAKKTAR